MRACFSGNAWERPARCAAAIIALYGAAAVAAQNEFPTRAIRVIVPSVPGGGTDLVARIVGQKLAQVFGQPVVIDNRGGAGGNVGTELGARSAPDGYTLTVATVSHVTNPHLYDRLAFDAIKDFAPVTQLTAQAYVLVVHPNAAVKSVRDLVAYANAKKGGISYASSGTGQASHLGMELLKTLGKFEATHIPYKGTSPSLVDVMSGLVDVSMVSMPAALPQMRGAKLRGIAVTTLKRSPLLPDLPSVAESGFPGYEVDGWKGFLVSAGTPRSAIAALYKASSQILAAPDVRERLAADGSEPVGSTPEQFGAYLGAEMTKWQKVIRQSGAKAD